MKTGGSGVLAKRQNRELSSTAEQKADSNNLLPSNLPSEKLNESVAPMEYHYSHFITYRSNLLFILIYRLERISPPKKVTFNIIKQRRNGQSC